MKKYILIDGEKFFYEEKELFHGRKTLDLKIAEENIKIFHSLIHDSGVRYGLMFGTLLGAIRENGFIKHDEDTDIYVLSEDKEAFYRLLPSFKNKGLNVVRNSDSFVSLMRNNEYIDIYFFESIRKLNLKRYRSLDNNYVIRASYIESFSDILFLGMNICIPSQPEKVLEILYGKNWKIPIKNSFAQPRSFRDYIIKKLPFLKNVHINENLKKHLKKIFIYF